MARTSVNRVLVNSENVNYRDSLVTASVCRTVSGPKGFRFIPDIATLDLFFKDCISYDSYAEIINRGGILYLNKQSNDEDEYPTYYLRITSDPLVSVVYPKSGVDYTPLTLVTEEGLADKVYLGTWTYAYEVRIDELIKYPSYFSVPHVTQINGYEGYALIWFGAKDESEPITSEFFNGGYRIPTDPEGITDENDLIEYQINYLIGVLSDVGTGPDEILQLPGLGYTVERDGNTLRFYSIYAYEFLGYSDMQQGYFNLDSEMNFDLLVRHTLDKGLVDFESLMYGPRVTDINLHFTRSTLDDTYNLRVTLDEYIEDFRVTMQYGNRNNVEDVMLDSKILRAKLLSTGVDYDYTNKSYEFLRKPKSLLLDVYSDAMLESMNELVEDDYMIYLLLDDGVTLPAYHTGIVDVAKKVNGFAILGVDWMQFTLNDQYAIAFNQSVKTEDTELFPYLPALWLIYQNSYLGDVSRYLIGDVPEDSQNETRVRNINVYIIEEHSVSLNDLIDSTGKSAVLNLVVKSFTKRYTKACEELISRDSSLTSIARTLLSKVRAQVPLVSSANIVECTITSRNTLKISVELEVARLSDSSILINFNVNL